jgi:hypothetical protein
MRKPLLKTIITRRKFFICDLPAAVWQFAWMGREKAKSARPIGFALFAETDRQ